MRVLCCPDKFRGTLSAREASDAIAAGCRKAGHSPSTQPLSDGGEGFLDCVGGANRVATVSNAVGDPIEVGFRLADGTAWIETALIIGPGALHGPADPMLANTFGVGEILLRALDAGADRMVLGLGGSCTSDGGFGALRALTSARAIRSVELVVAADVTTPFLDAAAEFAPQKGASPAQTKLLARRLEALADSYRDDYGIDVEPLIGGGAAGGLAAALALLGADIESGFEVVADEVDLADAIASADLVITGEGCLDPHSFDGKVVGSVAAAAREADVAVCAVVGTCTDEGRAAAEERGLTVVALDMIVGPRSDTTANQVVAAVSRLLGANGYSAR